MSLNIIFIVLIGLLTTYSDLKKKMISNRVILLGLLVAPLLHMYHILQNPSLVSVIPGMLYNFGFSVFAGVLLWLVYIWPAGDAKLFIAYSFLIPLNVYSVIDYSFISFDLLINTFVPVFLVMLILLLLKSKKSDLLKSLKASLDPYRLFMASIVILGFLWFVWKFLRLIGIPYNYLIAVVLLFLIMELFNNVLPFNPEIYYVLFVVLRFILDYRTVFTVGYVYHFAIILFAFVVMRYFVINLGFKMYTVSKKISELKPGMCLAEGIAEKRGGKKITYEKKEITQFSIPQILKERVKKEFIHGLSFEGLTEKEVNKIKRLRREGKIPFSSILVHTTVPFALFLFFGVILTIVLNGNFVVHLKMLIFG